MMQNNMWQLALVVVACGALAGLTACESNPAAVGEKNMENVSVQPFGKTADGKDVHLYTLTNSNGMIAKIMTYGALLTELHVPDKDGNLADVVLGYDNLDSYIEGSPYFGATVGRVANRIANAKFTLDRKEYKLAANNGPHSLHGGNKGYDKVVWKAAPVASSEGAAVRFSYLSPDGEEGYPGNLDITVTYTLTATNGLQIDYTAKTDKATPVNLTHHSYFNLAGAGNGDILGHEVAIAADNYTPGDDTLVPTGEIKDVSGTPFDFRQPHAIGARIKEAGGDPVGYDLNYVRNDRSGRLTQAVQVREPTSGRVMNVYTTDIGVQFYSGNFLDGSNVGKGGKKYNQYYGFCIEPQHYPDSINQPKFPSVVLLPGQLYRKTTVYRFSTD